MVSFDCVIYFDFPKIMSSSIKATVHPASSFDAGSDAEALHKAMKGIGTDEKAVINILCARSANQRREICQSFKHAYGKVCILRDFINDRQSKLADRT